MTESNLPILVLSLSALMLLGLIAFAILVISRLPLRRDSGDVSRLDQDENDFEDPTFGTSPLAMSAFSPDNVISRLSFRDSLDPEKFATASRESAMGDLSRLLVAHLGDGVSITIDSIRLVQSQAELVVSASREGRQLLKEAKATYAIHKESGRRLAQLRQGGRIKENLREVSAARKLTQLGAMSAAAIVGLAHIISGADIASRLKLIDKKIDLLLAFRRIDQMARLERIYTSAKELLSGPMSYEVREKLFGLRADLREQRAIWRMELQHHLNQVEDPNAAFWLTQMFTRTKSTDRSVHGQITEGQLQLALIEYSLRLDHTLASVGGMVREYEATLTGELVELKAVADLLQTKASFISGKHRDWVVEPTVNGMFSLVEQYEQVLSESVPRANRQVLLPAPDQLPQPEQ